MTAPKTAPDLPGTPVTIAPPLTVPWSLLHIVLIVLTGIAVTVQFSDRSYDNAFITFRYAANFASGNGLVYNIGDHFLGTTGPLFAIVVGTIAFISRLPVALCGGILSGMGLTLVGIGVYALLAGKRESVESAHGAGVLAALLIVTARIHVLVIGGEILLSSAFVIGSFYVVEYYRSRRGILWSAVLLAIATGCRPDSLLALVPLLVILARERRGEIPRFLLCYAVCLLPLVLAAWWFYGSLLPGSLAAQLAQRGSIWHSFGAAAPLYLWGEEAIHGGQNLLFSPYSTVCAVLAIGGLWRVYQRGHPARLLVAWSLLHVLIYAVLRFPFYHWYLVPFGIGWYACVGIGAVEGFQWLFRRMNQWTKRNLQTLQKAVLVVLAIVLISRQIGDNEGSYTDKSRRDFYTNILAWIDQDGGKKSSIGFYEIGYLGYYGKEHPIVDALGLVTRDISAPIAERDFTYAYQKNRPRYIIARNVVRPHPEAAPLDAPWFQREYRLVLRADLTTTHLVVFRRDLPRMVSHSSSAP